MKTKMSCLHQGMAGRVLKAWDKNIQGWVQRWCRKWRVCGLWVYGRMDECWMAGDWMADEQGKWVFGEQMVFHRSIRLLVL